MENGKTTLLTNPGTKLYVKGLLAANANTVLSGYQLEINPAKYSLFTGKTLEESTELVYFGGRWYDPEIGRFITVDPAEDGENWYSYCGNDPVNYIDSDGRFTSPVQAWQLLRGFGDSVYELGMAANAVNPVMMPFTMIKQMVSFAICAKMIYDNPAYFLTVLTNAGNGIYDALIGDLVYEIKNFQTVFYGKPTDQMVYSYGKRLFSAALTVVVVGEIAKVGTTAAKIALTTEKVEVSASTSVSQTTSTAGKGFLTFADLKKFLGSPGLNKAWHHIVEQCQIGKSGFGAESVHNTENMIAVDKATHAKITGYYNSKRFAFTNGLSVREWLVGQSFEKQYQFGIEVLKSFGVIP